MKYFPAVFGAVLRFPVALSWGKFNQLHIFCGASGGRRALEWRLYQPIGFQDHWIFSHAPALVENVNNGAKSDRSIIIINCIIVHFKFVVGVSYGKKKKFFYS